MMWAKKHDQNTEKQIIRTGLSSTQKKNEIIFFTHDLTVFRDERGGKELNINTRGRPHSI